MQLLLDAGNPSTNIEKYNIVTQDTSLLTFNQVEIHNKHMDLR